MYCYYTYEIDEKIEIIRAQWLVQDYTVIDKARIIRPYHLHGIN